MDLNFTLVFSSCTLNYDKNTVKKLGIQGFELLKKADNLCFQHGYPIIYLFSSRLILDFRQFVNEILIHIIQKICVKNFED